MHAKGHIDIPSGDTLPTTLNSKGAPLGSSPAPHCPAGEPCCPALPQCAAASACCMGGTALHASDAPAEKDGAMRFNSTCTYVEGRGGGKQRGGAETHAQDRYRYIQEQGKQDTARVAREAPP